jgi:hypothetical protein
MASPIAWAPKSPDRVFVADTRAHPPDSIPTALGRRAVTLSLRWRAQVMTKQVSQMPNRVAKSPAAD